MSRAESFDIALPVREVDSLVTESEPARLPLSTEDLYVLRMGEVNVGDDRLICAPGDGRVLLGEPQFTTEGEFVAEGQVVAWVITPDGTPRSVSASFGGWVIQTMVRDSDRVNASSPLFWIRPF